MEQTTVRQVSDVVKVIEEYRRIGKKLLFRGHRQDWDLLPVIARCTPRYPLPELERSMVKKFKRESLPFLEMRPESELDWLAVAQHHGLPTRLLDWSSNALASLWFAVSQEPADDEPGVLWIMTPSSEFYINKRRDTDPYTIKQTRVLVPKFISRRIVSQGAYFTVHASDTRSPYFTPLQNEDRFRGALRKLMIPAERFADFRFQLNRLGVNSLTIYPDLSGLCQYLRWHHFLLRDETVFSLEGRHVDGA
jgi:hypothetical protein